MVEVKNRDFDMKNIDFSSLDWHDAIIKKIEIDRVKPGIVDEVKFLIRWSNGTTNRLIFKDVYWAIFNLNFGVIADECIMDGNYIEINDPDYVKLKTKWMNLYSGIDAVVGYQITTTSTGSTMRIFAKTFELDKE